jgi:hypothetical protein
MGAAVSALPITPTEVVRRRVAEYMALPDSYPLVLHEPRVQDQLDRAHARQERRRYSAEPEVVTAFGGL